MNKNPRFCCWNFDLICHSSRDISTSGFGGHIPISSYQSLSQSPGLTILELAVIEYTKLARRNFDPDSSISWNKSISGLGCHRHIIISGVDRSISHLCTTSSSSQWKLGCSPWVGLIWGLQSATTRLISIHYYHWKIQQRINVTVHLFFPQFEYLQHSFLDESRLWRYIVRELPVTKKLVC